mgnify:CR=1 FL=1
MNKNDFINSDSNRFGFDFMRKFANDFFEQLQAADVSFPDAVRNVAVVNNMPVYKVGDSHDVISMELKGDGKTAAEALAEEIANANYFEQVIICDSALRGQDTELREDVMLTQDEVQKLAADLGVDLIFSFDRLDIHTKRGALFIDTFDGGFSVDAVDGIVAPVIRIYIPSRERPMLSFSKQDTISWEIEPTLSDKKNRKGGFGIRCYHACQLSSSALEGGIPFLF